MRAPRPPRSWRDCSACSPRGSSSRPRSAGPIRSWSACSPRSPRRPWWCGHGRHANPHGWLPPSGGTVAFRLKPQDNDAPGNVMPAQNIFDLTGKVAAIVGSGSGIGEAVTLGAARAGARVVGLDVKADAAADVAARARAEGGECEAAALDIRDASAV